MAQTIPPLCDAGKLNEYPADSLLLYFPLPLTYFSLPLYVSLCSFFKIASSLFSFFSWCSYISALTLLNRSLPPPFLLWSISVPLPFLFHILLFLSPTSPVYSFGYRAAYHYNTPEMHNNAMCSTIFSCPTASSKQYLKQEVMRKFLLVCNLISIRVRKMWHGTIYCNDEIHYFMF